MLCTQYRYIQCYVGRVKRNTLEYNQFNAKHVEGVKRHSKYAVRAHNVFAHNFLNIN